MRTWVRLPGERSQLFAAIGVRPVDAVTGKPPVGRLRAHLDAKEGATWRPAAARVLVGPSGVITCPGLDRAARPSPVPRRYRIRIDADLYRPIYRVTRDGIEFDAYQYNQVSPPASFATTATDALLAPMPGYPFPSELRVLYGVVTDAGGDPVEDAVVMDGGPDRGVTDAKGNFALVIRDAPDGVPLAIDAAHPRSNRVGSVTVSLPDDLRQGQTIQIA